MADDKTTVEKTIAEDLVVTKYKLAGEIVNKTLKTILTKCVVGESVREICIEGDNIITEETGKVYKKEKELKKGIAFPTCISVNNCICHFSPSKSDQDYNLQDGDLVKVDLGAHIDGFVAVVANTIVISKEQVTGRKADVIIAAYNGAQAALRKLKPETVNYEMTEAVQKVAESYKCKPIEGMLSCELKQFKIDGEKTIIQNPNEAQRKEHEKCSFELHEVYAIDVIISTGEDEFVAQFKYTALVMPNGVNLVTGIPFPSESYKSEHPITDEDVKKLLDTPLYSKKNKNKKEPAKNGATEPQPEKV